MNKKMKILKMMLAASPVCKYWGDRQLEPFVIITDESPDEVVHALCVFKPVLFTSGDKIDAILEALQVNYSEGTFFYFDGSEKAKAYIKQITTALKTDKAAGSEITSTFIVISASPLETEGFHVEYAPCTRSELFIQEYIPNVNSIGWAEDVADELNKNKSGNAALLYDAVALFYPTLKEREELEEYNMLVAAAKQIEEHNRQMMDAEGVVRIFAFALVKWIDSNIGTPFVRLPKVSDKALKEKTNLFFYDDNALYLSNKLFANITVSIRNLFSTTTLKRLLADAGVIDSNTKGYTSKMFVQREDGKSFRPEMIKIYRDSINFTGELSVDDYIKAGETDETYTW